MTHIFGFAIESMVAVLLLLTILYCVRLSKQLRLLKADERSLKATIGELVTATEIAERAIAELKLTASATDGTLGQHLVRGETLSAELGRQIDAADALMRRLAGIVAVSRPAAAAAEPAADASSSPPVAARPDPSSMVAAAAAFAARARLRMTAGKAA